MVSFRFSLLPFVFMYGYSRFTSYLTSLQHSHTRFLAFSPLSLHSSRPLALALSHSLSVLGLVLSLPRCFTTFFLVRYLHPSLSPDLSLRSLPPAVLCYALVSSLSLVSFWFRRVMISSFVSLTSSSSSSSFALLLALGIGLGFFDDGHACLKTC